MGSRSDWETMSHVVETLDALGVPCETRVVSAHRTPDLLFDYASTAAVRGLEVIIAGAGGAAHLPGMTASKTSLPVLGVPVESHALKGMDSLLSIVQMPAGIPVGAMAIGRSGAVNAALLAVAILGNKYPALRQALDQYPGQSNSGRSGPSRPERAVVRVGILGGGQLGRMLALSGVPLGLQFRFLDPEPSACACDVGELIVGDYTDPVSLDRFLVDVDCVTYEFENVPRILRLSTSRNGRHSSPRRVRSRSHRTDLPRKRFSGALGIPTARFHSVNTRADLQDGLGELGVPAILKTRRLGYDGKGQASIATLDDADAAWAELGEQPLILEERVTFAREMSILVARGRDDRTAFYPLTENHHREGILRLSLAPAPGVTLDLQNVAARIGHALLRELDHIGMLAIELFQVPGGFMANEIAPRVHNSGHWTIDGAVTSQFENHLRAILGLPLGDISTIGRSAMLNFIGDAPKVDQLLTVPSAHVHLYRKDPRPGRKVGHVTLVGADEAGMMPRLAALQRMVNALGG